MQRTLARQLRKFIDRRDDECREKTVNLLIDRDDRQPLAIGVALGERTGEGAIGAREDRARTNFVGIDALLDRERGATPRTGRVLERIGVTSRFALSLALSESKSLNHFVENLVMTGATEAAHRPEVDAPAEFGF